MNLAPKMLLNSQDDVARRKFAKQALSKKVNSSLEEFGFGSFLKNTVKKVLGMDDKKKDDEEKKSGSSDFNEADHPRDHEGRFTEAPQGSLSKGVEKVQEKGREADIKGKENELHKARISQWEADKIKWDAAATKKANEKIDKIIKGNLKKAQSELLKIREALKEENLSDEEFEKRTKKFADANKKVKKAKNSIANIRPEPFKTSKPRRGDKEDDEDETPPQKEKSLIKRVLDDQF